jgi:tRNA pseudouridine38-40 synthase
MFRYRITIEYDGTPFVGWQRQETGLGVQQVLEDAIYKFSSERIAVQGAGRTDAGVHALGQVAHFDLSKDWPTDTVRDAINNLVRPHLVSVIRAEQADSEFNARFDATKRGYLYRITNRRAPLAIDREHSWWVPVALDADAMHSAAQLLLGKHDFTTFRATNCQAKSAIKTLDELNVSRVGDEIRITSRARSFLYHQVRNMVGTLKQVGEGKWTNDDVSAAFAAKDRRAGGPTAPAHALYLTDVCY